MMRHDPDWIRLPALSVVMQSWRFTINRLKDLSTTIWLWASLYLLLKNIALVALVLVCSMFVIGLLICGTQARFYRYRFTHDALEIKSGVFRRSFLQIPLERILNVEFEQPLLYQLGDYVIATFDSAGQSKKDGVVPCMKKTDALAIKAKVLHLKEAEKGHTVTQVAASEPDLITPLPILNRGATDLFLYGFCHNRLFILIGIFIGLYYKTKEIVKDLDTKISTLLNAYLPDNGVSSVLLLIVMLICLVACSAFVSGVMQLISSYAYSLFKNQQGLSQVEGLFTQKQNHISLKKLQRVVIKETLMDRVFKRCGIELIQMNGKMLVPALRKTEINSVVQAIYPKVNAQALMFKRLSCYRVIKSFMLFALPLLALSYQAFALDYLDFGVTFFVMAIMVLIISALRWYRFGFTDNEDYLFVREGRFNQRTHIIDKTKLQAVTFSQSQIERLLGIATVRLFFAGKSLIIRGIDQHRANAICKDGISLVYSYQGQWI